MGGCCVPGCNHQNKTHKCRMFTFPTDLPTKRKWQEAVRRARGSPRKLHLQSPNRNSRVCACHFKDGNRSFTPTIFPRNVQKQFHATSPEKYCRRKRSATFSSRKLDFDGLTQNSSSQSLSKPGSRTDNQNSLLQSQLIEYPGDTEYLGDISVGKDSYAVNSDDELLPVQSLLNNEHAGSVLTERGCSPIRTFCSDMSVQTDFHVGDVRQQLKRLASVQVENSLLLSQVLQLQKKLADATTGQVAQVLELQKEMTEVINEQVKKLADVEAQNSLLRTQNLELQKKMITATPALYAAENAILKIELANLQKNLKESICLFLFKTIADKDNLVSHFTGLPNKQSFYALLHLFDNISIIYSKGWKVTRLDKENQLFLTLLKLRRRLSNEDLAIRFNIERTTVANLFLTWLMALHHVIVKNLMEHIPSRAKNQQRLPECFDGYPNTRIILDCTEVSTANPSLLSKQKKMYSAYKHKITSKALVGIAPNGTVTFVSDLYAGSTSDRDIVIKSGILNKLVPGDCVMADKGFNIEDLMPDGVTLNIPPFKETPQFTEEQVDETYGIAKSRIHVEREMVRIKNFEILHYIPQFMVPYASEVFQVCAALTNFQKPLIRNID